MGQPAGYNTSSAEPLSWSNMGDVEFGYMPFGGAAATWEVKQCGAQSVAKLGSGAHIALRQPVSQRH